MAAAFQQEYGGPTAGAFELQQRTLREIEQPIVCTVCGSAFFREVEFNQYSDIAMGSGTGGDIRVISQMPQALRVCLCGYPFSPNLTGVRGRTASAEMQAFIASLTKAHAFLKKAHAPAPVLDLSVFTKAFAPAQAVADLQVELTELGHAFDDSLLAATLTPPPATGDSAGVQLLVVETAEPVKVHPNSREGRAARAALRAAMAAAAEQAAV